MHPKLKRLWDRCDEVGECWIWRQATSKQGYPRCGMTGYNAYAHTAAWLIVRGEIPAGHQLTNTCGHRRCIRPAHWLPMTQAQRSRMLADQGAWHGPDRIAKIAAKARAKGKLDEGKAAYIREARGTKTADELCAEFSVNRTVIYRIWRGQSWATTAPNSSVFSMRA